MVDLLALTVLITLFIIIVFYCEWVIRRTASRNNVHFYVARDHDYSLNLYLGKPKRSCYYFLSCRSGLHLGEATHFQRFGLNYNDFKDLKWEDEPVEVFINIEE